MLQINTPACVLLSSGWPVPGTTGTGSFLALASFICLYTVSLLSG